MRVFAAGTGGAVGTRLVFPLTRPGHCVTGTCRSPRNAGRGGALGAELIALGQHPARVRCRVAGGC
jgi:hypothetical protein